MQPTPPPDNDQLIAPQVALAVDVVAFTILRHKLHILLVERDEEPFSGSLALPGGFVHPTEHLKVAAARKLQEVTRLNKIDAYLEQLCTNSIPNPRLRVVSVAYWAVCANLALPDADEDSATSKLAPVSELESGSMTLALDHADTAMEALERLRGKLEYTSVAARFCPPEFTIRSLRRAYEAVWNSRIDPGNFHRNVQRSKCFKKVKRKPASVPGKSGRPAGFWTAPEVESLGSFPLAKRRQLD